MDREVNIARGVSIIGHSGMGELVDAFSSAALEHLSRNSFDTNSTSSKLSILGKHTAMLASLSTD